MRLTRVACLSSAAALLLAVYAGMAHAASPATHTMTVRFPDGRVGQITYTGNTPPAVVVSPDLMVPTAMTSPFAAMDRMMAEMDRQAAEMLRVMNVVMSSPMAMPSPMMVIPAASGSGVCIRSVQVTFTGQGQPHVVSRTSGDCGPAGHQATPTALPPARSPQPGPRIIEAANNLPPRS